MFIIFFFSCRFAIDKLNIIDPEKPRRHEFIELESTQDDEKSVLFEATNWLG